ncbi:MAG: 2Fe-2S iron-sulfur cluster-binding protein [bacterium]|nr:2Fe-2S iron-sulfur cluster-binding protein [bacterium]
MPVSPARLPARPGEVIDRERPLTFTWNGRAVSGLAGDTIASALAAGGCRVFSRSMKYHRPRGILTADYWDPNTLVQVGEEPNVRAGHRLLEAGMAVSAQNAWPSLRWDAKALTAAGGRALSAGFYYKTFMRPRRLWPAYEKVLARFAPGGVVDPDSAPRRHDKRYAHPDVVVAGGGPAGLAAATAAATAGARVLLVEHDHTPGGHLRWGGESERALATGLIDAAHAAGVEILTDATVAGRWEDNWLAIVERGGAGPERLIKARTKVLVVAAGLIERPYTFAGNDRPGVMLSQGVRRLLNLWAVRPGTRAVVFSANEAGDAAAGDLDAAGAEVELVDARAGRTVTAALGPRSCVERVVLSDGTRLEADLLVTAAGWTAPTSLLNMAGVRPTYDPATARFFPSPPGSPHLEEGTVLSTGGLAGDGSLDELVAHGEATGRLAAARAAALAHRLQIATAWAAPVGGPEPPYPPDERAGLSRDPHPELYRSSTDGIVDLSEDVSSRDLRHGAAEGFDSVELVKRWTTATMGSAQGKLETVNTVAVLAEATSSTIAEVGTTTWRPPYAPVTLGALAGRMFEPERISSLHDLHVAAGMAPIQAGQWIRPEHYGDPAAEVRNVRANVGIIDVSPLGKLDVQGPDATELLSLLYVNKWRRLAIGAVRYGVMCAEDGVILDDGVAGRLGEEHYLMSTTSSGAGTMEIWIQNWLQTEHPDWRVRVTPVTDAYTSINVAGPRSRTLLERLVDGVDLNPEAFKYMQVRTGAVAGVAGCVMWRIGFTGELSYELHVPAGHGPHVWQALLAAGADLGVAPFGLEAQRIMRLEKGHFIVGQDTDALTKAPTAGLEWLIKLDKEDFAGRPELQWALEGEPGRTPDAPPRLVAVQPTDPSYVPPEACQLVAAGPDGNERIIGRITSSRFSPTLERSICLAQVEAAHAAPESTLAIVGTDGRRRSAVITAHHAHFDPEGERLRV